MSATVKAAARAAAARVSGDKGAASASAGTRGSKSGGGGGGGGGRDKIERDIFAARPSRGQALGVSAGGYDVYPETGDFETYDSDEVRRFICAAREEERASEFFFVLAWSGLVYGRRGWIHAVFEREPLQQCSLLEEGNGIDCFWACVANT